MAARWFFSLFLVARQPHATVLLMVRDLGFFLATGFKICLIVPGEFTAIAMCSISSTLGRDWWIVIDTWTTPSLTDGTEKNLSHSEMN